MKEARKVLIVDDDPGVLDTFTHMLQPEGYVVLTAPDGETALREIEPFHPDALLIDLHLRGMDGVTFLRQFRAREGGRHTPVAVITGDYVVDEATRQELKDLGADLYFKPLWFEDLMRIMARLIRRIK